MAEKNEIIKFIRGCYPEITHLALFTAVINLLMLTPSLYMLQIYDRVLASGNSITLLMLTLIVLAAYLVMLLLEYMRSAIVIRLGNRMDHCLSDRVYTACCRASFDRGEVDPGQRLQDLTQMRQILTGSTLFAFFDAPWFPVYLAVIFLFNFWLGIVALVGAALLILLAILNTKLTSNKLKEAGKYSAAENSLATASLQNSEVTEALGMLPELKNRWQALHTNFLYNQHKASERAALVSAITRSVRLALQSLILGFGGWLTLRGSMTPGMMIAGSILMGRTLAPVEQLINVWRNVSTAKLSYRRLVKLLHNYPPYREGVSLPEPVGNLAVENLTAASAETNKVLILHQLNFTLKAGEVLGIIGPSASGKSTLARALVGVWPHMSGKVRLDGADIRQWNRNDLGRWLGYLPQDVALFAGSVADNIARFREKADSREIIKAARLAGVHELILRLPQGYDTLIGHQGAGLSGGQKQRIGLARALYGDPALLVLDEPDASLDDAGKKALHQAIASLRQRGKTIVLVTHHSSLVALTSQLLLLQEGRIKDYGPTQAVLQARMRQSVKREQNLAHASLTSEIKGSKGVDALNQQQY
ncbi:type I secretion system permease/ATPase [Kalamiella sp. sgz302252]|uniref:type I secretion system permease/ATPase n=1 Tax=Pantoea sp. sgz302252 TaxID=3341827 RepID=UPI0036D290AB